MKKIKVAMQAEVIAYVPANTDLKQLFCTADFSHMSLWSGDQAVEPAKILCVNTVKTTKVK